MNQFVRRTAITAFAGITALSSGVFTSNADIMINETSMAGIILDLNTYAQDAVIDTDGVENTQDAGTTEIENTDKANTTPAVGEAPAEGAQEPAKEEAAGESEATQDDTRPEEKDFKLNLVYDRLGIAKVDNYLNIRKGPGEDRKIIGKLPKNAGCHIYKINKDGWAKIVSGKVTGWVKAEYLITDEEAEKYAKKVATKVATVNTQTLKVRFLPTLDSKVYDLIPQEEEVDVAKEYLNEDYINHFIAKHENDEFDITEGVDLDAMMAEMDDWVCIKIDDEKAFVAKEYVDISFKLERAVKAEELKTDGSSGVSSVRASMVEYAKQFLGNAYVWGGTSLTNGTDCSGFTMRIYEHFGYSIPRTSSAQSQYFTGISDADVKPGDLFFYGSNGRVSHVAMYIGGGQVIHASTERTGIKISNAYYRTPLKIGRIINE